MARRVDPVALRRRRYGFGVADTTPLTDFNNPTTGA
jgi:hypothetical protein